MPSRSRLLRTVLSAALLSAAPVAAQSATPGPYGVEQTWTSRDKLYHFGISAAGAGATYTGARWLGLGRWRAAALAAGVMAAVGVAREIDDSRRPGKYFSEKDLVWDAAGITVGIAIPDRLLFRAKRPARPR
jgi:uncharacterized protein YfiM (DUF2279 family)